MTPTPTRELYSKHSHMSSTKMMRLTVGKKQPAAAIAAAAPQHVFAAGDAAILLYERRHRIYNVPVTIVHSCWSADERFTTEEPTRARADISYLVRSEYGGELTVQARYLRPGSILDRIITAIEFDPDEA